MPESPTLYTPRLILRLGDYQDAAAIAHYYQTNREFLQPFEPTRSEEFFTPSFWQVQVQQNQLEFENEFSLRFFLFEQTQPDTVVGTLNLNQIFRGVFHAAVLSYSLGEIYQGQGLMFEAATRAISYTFNELNLHRLMANYMPRNRRSGNLLKRLGFTVEGYARNYLRINQHWEDHILTSLTNAHWQASDD